MIKYLNILLISLTLSGLLVAPRMFSADCVGAECPTGDSSGDIKLPNPLGDNMTNPSVIAGNIIKVVLGLVGSISLVVFIYGGLLWMTSSGNKEQITKGRNTLIWATLGLLVIFSSYTIINFILRKLAGQS